MHIDSIKSDSCLGSYMDVPAASPLATMVSSKTPILIMASVSEARRLSSYLSCEELRRLSRYTRQKDRELSAVSHGLKRLYLSRVLNLDPFELKFKQTINGQPFLETVEKINFSISHSGDWSVLAISHKGRVGVDIETGKNLSTDSTIEGKSLRSQIAQKILTHTEWCEFLRNNCTERLLAYWTQKEAISKALGLGLSMDLSTILCDGKVGRHQAVSPSGSFNIVSYNFSGQAILSVAMENTDEVKVFRYDGGKLPH